MASADELKNAPKVKEILYGQPLNKEQLDSILDNFTDLKILYHTPGSGLKFQGDSILDEPLLFFRGRGDTTEIQSAYLKQFMTDYPTHAEYIYDLFSKGILTFETFENTALVYEEFFQHQEDIEASSGSIEGQFQQSENGAEFINTGSGGRTI